MEEPISNLTDTVIEINWQLSVYINPENIEKIKEDCERLLTKVFNKYKVELRYEETLYVFATVLPRDFATLGLYFKILAKTLKFLDSRNCMWYYGSLSFNFTNLGKDGFVKLKEIKGYLKIYYHKDCAIIKIKVPIKNLVKLT